MARRNYGNSCDANIRERHPDGTERPCMRAATSTREYTYYDTGSLTLGLYHLCPQHAMEHDHGLEICDPDRPALRRVNPSLPRNVGMGA